MKGFFIFAAVPVLFWVAGCEITSNEPPPVPVRIESVSIVTEEEGGRIAAYADFSGYLSNGAATLLEPRQRREGYRIYLEVMERIPKDAVGTAALVPIERRIPIDTAGLAPGVYIVNLNGREEHLEIDGAGLRPASDRGQFL